jgi:TolB-like protein
MTNFFQELKRRHVFRVAIAYAVVAWLVVQLVNNLVPLLGVPDWIGKAILILLIAGFPIALVITWGFELTPEGARRTSANEGGSARPKLDAVGDKGLGKRSSKTESGSAASVVKGLPSLAVLPFANLSADQDQEYFADGLSEELLNQLAHMRDLRVIGRTSSFAFKGKNEDLRVIGEALGVDHILEGSVRKSRDNVRITAQLIDAANGSHLWSQSYDRRLDDIFAIQDNIAVSVAEAIGVTLGVGDLGRKPGMTRNVAAYDEYLQARAANREFRLEGFERAVEHLKRAIALDPSYALAWLFLRDVYAVGASHVPGKSEEWLRKSDDALARARELIPDSLPVLIAETIRSSLQGKWREAGTLVKGLPVLATNNGADNGVWGIIGLFFEQTGQLSLAIENLERQRQAEPLGAITAFNLGEAYGCSGQTSAAMAEFDRGLKLEGYGVILRGSALALALGARDRTEIDKRLAVISGANDPGKDVTLAMARFLEDPEAGRAEVRRRAAVELARKDRNNVDTSVLAIWAGYYGEPEIALQFLRAIQMSAGAAILPRTAWRPVFREMRKLPAFKDFVREMGLVDYWRDYGWSDFSRPAGDDDFECF